MESLRMNDDGLDKEHALSPLEVINERLERAIEQLRQANQALQTTGDVLAALNHQVEMMNEEAESLNQELVRLRDGYVRTLEHMPFPVLLVDKEGKIEAWNAAAQRLFRLALNVSMGLDLSEIPVQPSLGGTLRRKHRAALEGAATPMLKNHLVQVQGVIHRMDVHFTPLSRERSSYGVLVMFVSSQARDGMIKVG